MTSHVYASFFSVYSTLDITMQVDHMPTAGPSISSSSNEVESNRLGTCHACQLNSAKYRCPSCSFPTCSLPCSKLHKSTSDNLGCQTGRMKSQWSQPLKMNQMSWGELMRDQSFISDLSRKVVNVGQDLVNGGLIIRNSQSFRRRGGRGGRGGGVHLESRTTGKDLELNPDDDDEEEEETTEPVKRLDHLTDKEEQLVYEALKQDGVTLKLLPKGMSRRKVNSSRFNPKERRVEWMSEIVLRPHLLPRYTEAGTKPKRMTSAAECIRVQPLPSVSSPLRILQAAFRVKDTKGKGKSAVLMNEVDDEYTERSKAWLEALLGLTEKNEENTDVSNPEIDISAKEKRGDISLNEPCCGANLANVPPQIDSDSSSTLDSFQLLLYLEEYGSRRDKVIGSQHPHNSTRRHFYMTLVSTTSSHQTILQPLKDFLRDTNILEHPVLELWSTEELNHVKESGSVVTFAGKQDMINGLNSGLIQSSTPGNTDVVDPGVYESHHQTRWSRGGRDRGPGDRATAQNRSRRGGHGGQARTKDGDAKPRRTVGSGYNGSEMQQDRIQDHGWGHKGKRIADIAFGQTPDVSTVTDHEKVTELKEDKIESETGVSSLASASAPATDAAFDRGLVDYGSDSDEG